MPPFLRSRLRSRLLILSLASVLPALGVIVYTESVERSQARTRALDDTLRLTRLAARQPASTVEGAQRLLQTLAQFPALGGDVPACRAVLRNVARDNPGYSNLFVVDPRGVVECSSRSGEHVSVLDRPWFQRAIQTHAVVVGDYQISRATGRPDIIVAFPVLDATGAVERVLGAGLTVELPETNIVWVDAAPPLASRLVPALAEKGVLATGTGKIRFVTHLDVNAADITATIAAVRAIAD